MDTSCFTVPETPQGYSNSMNYVLFINCRLNQETNAIGFHDIDDFEKITEI